MGTGARMDRVSLHCLAFKTVLDRATGEIRRHHCMLENGHKFSHRCVCKHRWTDVRVEIVEAIPPFKASAEGSKK